MKRTLFSRVSRAAIPTRKYRAMRDPAGHEVDITADLTDGSDGALGDVLPVNGGDGAQQQAPAGTQHVHGDAKPANQQQQQPAPEPTLREQLSTAFKGPDDKPTDQQNAQNVQPNTPATPPVALTQDGDGKWRTPDGLFASNEQVQAFQAAQAAPPADNTQQQSPVLQGLTPVEQQQFQSLPAELRQYVERTMEGLNTRAQRFSEYDQLEQQLIGPRRQAWAQQGLNPALAINQLFTLSDFASTNPGEFVMWFAQQQNLDLDALLDAREAAQQNVNPEVRQLQGQVQQLAGTVQQFQTNAQQQAQAANYNAVLAYAEEKDAQGNLARPYITDVMDTWATQIAAIRAANPNMPNSDVLEKAYQNACWASPEVRAKMQAASNTAQAATEAARAENAKRAGSSIAGGPAGSPSATPNNGNRTLRQEIEQQFAAQRA